MGNPRSKAAVAETQAGSGQHPDVTRSRIDVEQVRPGRTSTTGPVNGSARSLLTTVLGFFALPLAEPVWASALTSALSSVSVDPAAARQALARGAREGWIESSRVGRRSAWSLTDGGREALRAGVSYVVGFAAREHTWDGRWLVLTGNLPSSDYHLRQRLRWAGFGQLAAGTWLSPHADRGAEAIAIVDELGWGDGASTLVAQEGVRGDCRRLVEQAWDLDGLAGEYRQFMEDTALRDTAEQDPFARQVLLLNSWRRLPLLDPGLPAEGLPADWAGHAAARMFLEHHKAQMPEAEAAWRRIIAASAA